MSDLDRIRHWRDRERDFGRAPAPVGLSFSDIDLLLSEIDRRDAILRCLADSEPSVEADSGGSWCSLCGEGPGWNDGPDLIKYHGSDCAWRQARELLGEP